MKMETVIQHEITNEQIFIDENQNTIGIRGSFKIKHSNGVKNNTITLRNLIRTCPDFRKHILDQVDKHISPEQRIGDVEVIPPNRAKPCHFDIFPGSGSKGSWYVSFYRTPQIMGSLVTFLDDALRNF